MPTGDLRGRWKQGSKLALTQEPGELPAVLSTPLGTPMLEEDAGVSLDGEPPIRRGHSPVASDPYMFGYERPLVGLVADMFDDRVRNNKVEGVVGEWQVSAIGDNEVLPRDRVLGASIELIEQNSARHEHFSSTGHSIGDDVFEGLVLARLNPDDEHAASIDRPHGVLESLCLPVSVEDTEAARRSRDEVAHNGSLWQAMVAKPLAAIVVAVVCLLAAGCSSVATQEAGRSLPPSTDDQPTESDRAAESTTVAGQGTTAERGEVDDAEGSSANESDTTAAASSTADRGSRNLGDESVAEGELVAAQTDNPPDAPAATPEPEPEPEAPAEPVESAEPAPTATPTPAAVPTPTVEPTATPNPVFVSPAPTGPVPSDDIVITGPQVDESQPATISDEGAAACASTERAIEFLDVGDTGQMTAALEEASGFAGQAVEPEISLMSPDLAAAGADEAAAVAAIIATLNACAVYGYQV